MHRAATHAMLGLLLIAMPAFAAAQPQKSGTPPQYPAKTIRMLAVSSLAINPSLYRIPYDTEKDLAPVSLLTVAPNSIVAHPSLPVQSLRELAALAKSKPGQLTYASPGSGQASHLAMELFAQMTGTRYIHVPCNGGGPSIVAALAGQTQLLTGALPTLMPHVRNATHLSMALFERMAKLELVHVPYKGTGQGIIDLMGGHVQLMFGAISTMPQVRAGKLKLLAVASAKRSAVLPEVPAVAEGGVQGYELTSWYGALAPAGTAAAIVNRLNAEMVKVLNQPEVKARLTDEGAEPAGNSPQQFTAFIRAERAKYAEVVSAARVSPAE